MTSPNFLYLTDSDSITDVLRPGSLVVLLITRPEIERGTVGDVVARMMALSDNATSTINAAGSVVIQVDGYNDDPRELMDIPEVREFFAEVNNQWSYWAHFLDHTLTDSMNLLTGLLLHPTRRIMGDRNVGNVYDPDQIREFLSMQVKNVARLYLLHDIRTDDIVPRMESMLGAMFGGTREHREIFAGLAEFGIVDF